MEGGAEELEAALERLSADDAGEVVKAFSTYFLESPAV
jgi:hypothetical protein